MHDTRKRPESWECSMAVTGSILRADEGALQREWGFTWPSVLREAATPLAAQHSLCLGPVRVQLQLLFSSLHCFPQSQNNNSGKITKPRGFFKLLDNTVCYIKTWNGISLGCSDVFLQNVLMESIYFIFFFWTKSFMDLLLENKLL